jgi:hypothetical protein
VSERGEDFDAKREAYEAARADLARLYDSPDKSTQVHAYRGQLKRAQAAVLRAHNAMMAA